MRSYPKWNFPVFSIHAQPGQNHAENVCKCFSILAKFLAYLMIFQSELSCPHEILQIPKIWGKNWKKNQACIQLSINPIQRPKPKIHVPDSSLDSVYSSMDIARAQKTSRRGSVTASPKAKQASSPHAKVQGRPQQCQFLGQQP